jgi:hydroxyacylglutathione hydrolase
MTVSALPNHLAQSESQGAHPGQPVAQFECGPYRNFVYLAVAWKARCALVIDPARELEPILEALATHGLELTGIVLTHTHHDHISGVPGLLERHPGLPVHVHPLDLHRLPAAYHSQVRPIEDGYRIPLGPGSADELQVIHAPGHSAGELCLLLETHEERYLFTGDTLFIRDCGRTDLPTGNDAQMYQTLQRLKTLAPDTLILPGHHYTRECASRLATELTSSPPLLAKSIEELAAL